MTAKEFFKIVPARRFFTDYAPGVNNFYHKSRGIDGNKKEITFTKEEKILMRKAAKKLAKDLARADFSE